MRTIRISLLLFAIISLFYACKDDTETISGELNLLCYNVAGLPTGISSSNPALYSTRISPLLNDYDIVHLQEDFCFHDSIILHANHPFITETGPCGINGDGLNTLSNFEIKNYYKEAWEDCYLADCLSKKGFSFSTIQIEEGIEIDCYNLHCNAGSKEADFVARSANIRQFFHFYSNKQSTNPCIVMGDFNSRYTREKDTINVFLQNGFTDLWITQDRNGMTPEFGSKLNDCIPNESSIDCEKVDKIFIKSSETVELEIIDFRQGDDVRFYYNGIDSLPLSDHSPLQAKIRYILNP